MYIPREHDVALHSHNRLMEDSRKNTMLERIGKRKYRGDCQARPHSPFLDENCEVDGGGAYFVVFLIIAGSAVLFLITTCFFTRKTSGNSSRNRRNQGSRTQSMARTNTRSTNRTASLRTERKWPLFIARRRNCDGLELSTLGSRNMDSTSQLPRGRFRMKRTPRGGGRGLASRCQSSISSSENSPPPPTYTALTVPEPSAQPGSRRPAISFVTPPPSYYPGGTETPSPPPYDWETTSDEVAEEQRFSRYTNSSCNDHMRDEGDVADLVLPRRQASDRIVIEDQAGHDGNRESLEISRQAPGLLTVLNRQVGINRN